MDKCKDTNLKNSVLREKSISWNLVNKETVVRYGVEREDGACHRVLIRTEAVPRELTQESRTQNAI